MNEKQFKSMLWTKQKDIKFIVDYKDHLCSLYVKNKHCFGYKLKQCKIPLGRSLKSNHLSIGLDT